MKLKQRLQRYLKRYLKRRFPRTTREGRALHLYYRGRFLSDLLGTTANAEFLADPHFEQAYLAANGISVWPVDIRWRAYNLFYFAEYASRLEGDFVECGTDRGGMSFGILHYLNPDSWAGRQFYLFDTFRGLEQAQLTDVEKNTTPVKEGLYPDVYEQVLKTFQPYPFVKVVRGVVPESLPNFTGSKIAYLHIDMNVALPEVAAFNYFWDALVPGAAVLFDDYGFPRHEPQKTALDAAAAAKGRAILLMPTGQGLLIK